MILLVCRTSDMFIMLHPGKEVGLEVVSDEEVEEEEEEADEEVVCVYNERNEKQRKLITGITM